MTEDIFNKWVTGDINPAWEAIWKKFIKETIMFFKSNGHATTAEDYASDVIQDVFFEIHKKILKKAGIFSVTINKNYLKLVISQLEYENNISLSSDVVMKLEFLTPGKYDSKTLYMELKKRAIDDSIINSILNIIFGVYWISENQFTAYIGSYIKRRRLDKLVKINEEKYKKITMFQITEETIKKLQENNIDTDKLEPLKNKFLKKNKLIKELKNFKFEMEVINFILKCVDETEELFQFIISKDENEDENIIDSIKSVEPSYEPVNMVLVKEVIIITYDALISINTQLSIKIAEFILIKLRETIPDGASFTNVMKIFAKCDVGEFSLDKKELYDFLEIELKYINRQGLFNDINHLRNMLNKIFINNIYNCFVY